MTKVRYRLNAWDRVVGFFSPATMLRNMHLRGIAEARNGYPVEDTPSLDGFWGAPQTANSAVSMDRQKIADRVRELSRRMPWMAQAIDNAVAYRVGEGFTFKPMVLLDDGTPDKKTNDMIKDAFKRWCEHADVNGRDHFGDLQELAQTQLIECGEAVMIHRFDAKEGYRLQTIEPDCIGTLAQRPNIDNGIEYDPQTNRFIKYWFTNRESTPQVAQQEFSCRAEDVIHLFRPRRPWQRRGISPLAQTVIIAADLGEYLSNELAAQQMASRWLAFVTDPNYDAGTNSKRVQETLYNLTIEYMEPGKNVQLAPGAARPTLGVENFQRIFLRILSTILHVPFHVISGEYAQMNYNTLREVRNATIHTLKPEWGRFTRHFLNPVYARWMDCAVLTGELKLKNYYRDPWRYRNVYWMPPGIESVDILRDLNGVIAGMKAGIYDPQDWIMSQGEDPEETAAGLAEYQRLLDELKVKTDLNPAEDSNTAQENANTED